MKKLIIFDLDGTLLNTVEDLANSVNYALGLYNFPTHNVEQYKFMVGNGTKNLILRALPAQNRYYRDIFETTHREFLSHYSKNADKFTKPYNGIIDLLEKLQKNGFLIAVASNKIHEAAVMLVKKFFPTINFVAVFGQRTGFPIKPDPLLVEEILNIAQVSPVDTLYIGDTSVDIQTAKNAGVDAAGVTWGFRPRTELEEFSPNFIVDTAKELEKIIFSQTKN
ncbi:MAG: HAD family hydrolase [Prevotellaceae bacterium]|jgi:phosphoglycolate phosphatase|nr:HAD family hydrolase [Prevotellaceae bacterium]